MIKTFIQYMIAQQCLEALFRPFNAKFAPVLSPNGAPPQIEGCTRPTYDEDAGVWWCAECKGDKVNIWEYNPEMNDWQSNPDLWDFESELDMEIYEYE